MTAPSRKAGGPAGADGGDEGMASSMVMEFDATTRERLVRALEEGPALRLAVLFGSAAEGRWREDSDVDVGIVPADPDLPLFDEAALQASLARAAGREVDLVRLDRASTLVRWQAAKSGRVLTASDDAERVRFQRTAAAEWIDFAPSLRRAQETFRRAVRAHAESIA